LSHGTSLPTGCAPRAPGASERDRPPSCPSNGTGQAVLPPIEIVTFQTPEIMSALPHRSTAGRR
jgi:hypothetical protein